jgi:hypothetical protein
MPCGSFPRNRRYARWTGLLVLGLFGPPLAFGVPVSAAGKVSFIYCLDHAGARVFAGKTTTDGKLKFGVSVWSPAGHNISVFGIAAKTGRGWRFTENLAAKAPSERCELDIVREARGTLRVTAAPGATCQAHGGANTEIGAINFPPTAYEGSVTTELDDPETFQKVGKCVAKDSG